MNRTSAESRRLDYVEAIMTFSLRRIGIRWPALRMFLMAYERLCQAVRTELGSHPSRTIV